MTATQSTQVEADAFRLGACGKLTKPFTMHELLTTVKAVVA